MVKPCVKCGAKDRYESGRCRSCHKARCAKYRQANSEKVRATTAIWKKINIERAKVTDAKWREKNPDKVRAANAKWRAANPEKAKAADAKYRKNNIEKARAATAKWVKANTERLRVAITKWKEKNPDKRRIYKHNRRAREQFNGGKLSQGLAATLFERQRGLCACCHAPLGKDYHLDHIMPLKLGGENKDSNIQLLRTGCNLSKGTKHPIEYMQSKGLLL